VVFCIIPFKSLSFAKISVAYGALTGNLKAS